jgi:dipeptidyl aminopeptidase/acylaminoacyl peptidase
MLGLASDEGDAASSDPVLRTSDRVQAVVAYFPPVDLRAMAGPNDRFPALDFPKEQAEAVSPIGFVSKDDPPTLLVHGDADRLVPISNSNRMEAALREAGVETKLIVIEGGEHGFRSNPEHRPRADKAMVEWFTSHLGKASKPTAGD